MKVRTLVHSLVLQSHYHTPSAVALAAFPVVVRAGHLRAASDYAVERRTSLGHDLIYCISGKGVVRMEGRSFNVSAGELVWIDGQRAHAHWANPHDPWEVLWLRLDGRGLSGLRELLGAVESPVFEIRNRKAIQKYIREIFRVMAAALSESEEVIHVQLAQLVVLLKKSRREAGAENPMHSEAMERVLNRMTLYPHQIWTSKQLAKLAAMSVPVFYRNFRQITNTSPIDWLRRQRINLAKRRLVESNDSIKIVAEQVGYNSAFYFSRDFKRHTNQSPSVFRTQEKTGQT